MLSHCHKPHDLDIHHARWAGLFSWTASLLVIGPMWFAAMIFLDIAGGGTFGGFGAAARAGDSWWLPFAYIGVTTVAAAAVLLIGRHLSRKSFRRARRGM